MVNRSDITKFFILNKNRIIHYWCGLSFFVERDGIYTRYPYYNFENYTTDELITDIILKLNSEGKKKISFNPIDEFDELKISTNGSSGITLNSGAVIIEDVIGEYNEISYNMIQHEEYKPIDFKSKKDSIRKVLLEKGIL